MRLTDFLKSRGLLGTGTSTDFLNGATTPAFATPSGGGGGSTNYPTTVNAISTTATAIVGDVNRCTATSAAYTVTIPDGSANTDLLLVAVTYASTKLVTISGKLRASSTQTRAMRNGESFLFRWNTTLGGWEVADQVIRPYAVTLKRVTSQSLTSGVWAAITFTSVDNGDADMFDSGNGRVTVPRAGRYNGHGLAYWTSTSPTVGYLGAAPNASTPPGAAMQIAPVGGGCQGSTSFPGTVFAAADYVNLLCWMDGTSPVVAANVNAAYFGVTELPIWL
jgi:hypothetical protein